MLGIQLFFDLRVCRQPVRNSLDLTTSFLFNDSSRAQTGSHCSERLERGCRWLTRLPRFPATLKAKENDY